jgi:hypothetical protein
VAAGKSARGVTLVTLPDSLTIWNNDVAGWKADHGF